MSQQEFDFTMILTGLTDFDDDIIDALCAAGCDDATVAQRYGRVYVTFSRRADALEDAVVSAISDITNAGIGAGVLRVDTCNLVTKAEIARRIGRTRQLVGQYISGQRGPGGFPPPACRIAEGHPLWYWCEVAFWLSENDIIKPDDSRDATVIGAINSILELEYFRTNAPEMTQGLLRKSDLCKTVCAENDVAAETG
jgi:hypothetical protein